MPCHHPPCDDARREHRSHEPCTFGTKRPPGTAFVRAGDRRAPEAMAVAGDPDRVRWTDPRLVDGGV
jgi:hypothetical protein